MRIMILGVTLVLSACGREQTFDERYSQAENDIEQRTRELDEQLDNTTAVGASETGLQAQPK